jgi:hypothetical protein
MEPERSLQLSEEPTTDTYPEPDKSSPHCNSLSMINFNIILRVICRAVLLKGRNHLKDLGIDVRMLLNEYSGYTEGGCGLNSGKGPLVGSYEHYNEILGSVRAGNFLTSSLTVSFSSGLSFIELLSFSLKLTRNKKSCPSTCFISNVFTVSCHENLSSVRICPV